MCAASPSSTKSAPLFIRNRRCQRAELLTSAACECSLDEGHRAFTKGKGQSMSAAASCSHVFMMGSLSLLAVTTVYMTAPRAYNEMARVHVEEPVAPQQHMSSSSGSTVLAPLFRPTPEDWKALSEEKKRRFIVQNYGLGASSLEPRRPPAAATLDAPRSWDKGPRSWRRRIHAQAAQPTPEDWKALSEESKREFISRNYGTPSKST